MTIVQAIAQDQRGAVVQGKNRVISNDVGSNQDERKATVLETSYIDKTPETKLETIVDTTLKNPKTKTIVEDIAQDQRAAVVQGKNRAISSDKPKTKKRKTEHYEEKNKMKKRCQLVIPTMITIKKSWKERRQKNKQTVITK